MEHIEQTLEQAGVKPTSNRILVLRELMRSVVPLSLGELDLALDTLEKSSILRALKVLRKNHLVHSVEDGEGVVKYECCHSGDSEADTDMHVHFYCESCRKLVCFEDIPVPSVNLPDNYKAISVNYTIKGLCPECDAKADD